MSLLDNKYFGSKNNSGFSTSLFKKQYDLMTTHFSQTSLPWISRSKWIGYSAVFYFFPPLIVKPSTWPMFMLRIALFMQPFVSFYSDYLWTGKKHISHGLDRLLSTVLTFVFLNIGIYYLKLYTIPLAFPPIYFFYQGKCAVSRRDYPAYIFNHTLWHITSPISGSIVLLALPHI